MVKDYYLILEVDRNASDQAIKHNYRRLALKYHPDKNSAPKAHDIFLLINEAYQVLGDARKRASYNFLYDQLRASRDQSPPKFKTRSTYNRQFNNNNHRRTTNRTTKQYKPPRFGGNPHYKKEEVNYAYYARYFRLVSLAGFLFCFLLILDYLLVDSYPYKIVNKERSLEQSAIISQSQELSAVSLRNFNPPVDQTHFYFFDAGDKMNVYKTPIFGITTQVERVRHGAINSISPNSNIYNVFSFLLLVLFMTSTSGLFILKNPEYTFNAGVSSGVLIPVVFYIVFFA